MTFFDSLYENHCSKNIMRLTNMVLIHQKWVVYNPQFSEILWLLFGRVVSYLLACHWWERRLYRTAGGGGGWFKIGIINYMRQGGSTIRGVMDQTRCHIHFPDSNRNSSNEKSNQEKLFKRLKTNYRCLFMQCSYEL